MSHVVHILHHANPCCTCVTESHDASHLRVSQANKELQTIVAGLTTVDVLADVTLVG